MECSRIIQMGPSFWLSWEAFRNICFSNLPFLVLFASQIIADITQYSWLSFFTHLLSCYSTYPTRMIIIFCLSYIFVILQMEPRRDWCWFTEVDLWDQACHVTYNSSKNLHGTVLTWKNMFKHYFLCSEMWPVCSF